jgi:hypothetical protein
MHTSQPATLSRLQHAHHQAPYTTNLGTPTKSSTPQSNPSRFNTMQPAARTAASAAVLLGCSNWVTAPSESSAKAPRGVMQRAARQTTRCTVSAATRQFTAATSQRVHLLFRKSKRARMSCFPQQQVRPCGALTSGVAPVSSYPHAGHHALQRRPTGGRIAKRSLAHLAGRA